MTINIDRETINRPSVGEDETSSWYAIRTRTNQELLVTRILDKIPVEYFLPRFQEGIVRRCVFPGYLFVKVDRESDLDQILQVPGINYILPQGDTPQPIPSEIVSSLRQRAESGNFSPMLSPEEIHLISSGLFTGREAVLDQTWERGRKKVLMEMGRRTASIIVDGDNIQTAQIEIIPQP